MTALTRIPGWRGRLEEAIDAIKHVPFDWRDHDCAFGLVARTVVAVTGADPAAAWRGRYTSRLGALRVMRNDGFDNVADLVATILPEIHPSRARIGDIAAFPDETPFGYALGVVNGERVFVLMESGLGTMELLQASRAFQVG